MADPTCHLLSVSASVVMRFSQPPAEDVSAVQEAKLLHFSWQCWHPPTTPVHLLPVGLVNLFEPGLFHKIEMLCHSLNEQVGVNRVLGVLPDSVKEDYQLLPEERFHAAAVALPRFAKVQDPLGWVTAHPHSLASAPSVAQQLAYAASVEQSAHERPTRPKRVEERGQH